MYKPGNVWIAEMPQFAVQQDWQGDIGYAHGRETIALLKDLLKDSLNDSLKRTATRTPAPKAFQYYKV